MPERESDEGCSNARVVEMMLPTGKQMANVQHHSEPTAETKEEVSFVGR
jgi:hypothetical protein